MSTDDIWVILRRIMIAHVSGTVSDKTGHNSLIVDVGGLGYEVQVPSNDFSAAAVDAQIKLHTYHHVREQSQELYGFSQPAAKLLFERLLEVQGVGPKAGLAILSLGSPQQIWQAIAAGNFGLLQAAGGVGKRLAQRIVVDLADKIAAPLGGEGHLPGQNGTDDALDALVALGYSPPQAAAALSGLDSGQDASARLKQALERLAS